MNDTPKTLDQMDADDLSGLTKAIGEILRREGILSHPLCAPALMLAAVVQFDIEDIPVESLPKYLEMSIGAVEEAKRDNEARRN